jgi:GNAT acetyltransferase-like protein
MLSGCDTPFRILRHHEAGPIETKWQICLANSDLSTHYVTPEYFFEPAVRGRKPFAILSMAGDDVTAVLTGIHDGGRVQSGLSVRPQIAFSRHADRPSAMRNLIAGLLREAQSAQLVELFLWSDMAGLVDARFHEKRCEGVVILDLSQGAGALFRRFSSNKKTNIKRAIRHGVSVAPAEGRDDVSAYYAIYADWARRKALPVTGEEQFQETFALTRNRQLLLARYEGQVIAGIVLRFFPGRVMEYAANSSLNGALYLRPNDLLHWRAIEWACGEGITKYSLGGAHLFLRKFGGEIVSTTRHRLDLSVFRRYAIGDWIAERVEEVRPFLPSRVVDLGRSLRNRIEKVRAYGRGSP